MVFHVTGNSKKKFSGISHVIDGLNLDNKDLIYNNSQILNFLIHVKNADLIIVHGIFNIYSIFCPLFYKKKKLHLILHGQTQRLEKLTVKKYIWLLTLKKVLKNYNILQYFSENELKNCKLKTIPSLRKVIVPNGVNLEYIQFNKYFNDPLKFLYIGRIDEYQKGLLSFFLKKIETDVIFNVYGPDSKTKNKLLKLNLDKLNIYGPEYDFNNKKELFLNHDFAFLPSHFEGMPIFALEALSNGLPLICTRSCNLGFLPRSKSLIIVENQNEIINFINNLRPKHLDRKRFFEDAQLCVKELGWNKIRNKILSKHF